MSSVQDTQIRTEPINAVINNVIKFQTVARRKPEDRKTNFYKPEKLSVVSRKCMGKRRTGFGYSGVRQLMITKYMLLFPFQLFVLFLR